MPSPPPPVTLAVLFLASAITAAVYPSVAAAAPDRTEKWAVDYSGLRRAERMAGTIRGGRVEAEAIKPREGPRSLPERLSSDSAPNGDGKKGGDSTAHSQRRRDDAGAALNGVNEKGADSIAQPQKSRDIRATRPNDDGKKKKKNSLSETGKVQEGVEPRTAAAALIRRQTALLPGKEDGGRKQPRRVKVGDDRQEVSWRVEAAAPTATTTTTTAAGVAAAGVGGLAPGSAKKAEILGFGTSGERVSRSFRARRRGKDNNSRMLFPSPVGTVRERHGIDLPNTATSAVNVAADATRTGVEWGRGGQAKDGGGRRGGGGGTKDGGGDVGEEEKTHTTITIIATPFRPPQPLSPENRSPARAPRAYYHRLAGSSFAHQHRRRAAVGVGVGGGGVSQNGNPRRLLQNPPSSFPAAAPLLWSSRGSRKESIVFSPEPARPEMNPVRGLRADRGTEPGSSRRRWRRITISAPLGGMEAPSLLLSRFATTSSSSSFASSPLSSRPPAARRIHPSADGVRVHPKKGGDAEMEGTPALLGDNSNEEEGEVGVGERGNGRAGKRRARRDVVNNNNDDDNIVVSVGDVDPGSGFADADISGGGGGAKAKLTATSSTDGLSGSRPDAGNRSSGAGSVGGDAESGSTGLPVTGDAAAVGDDASRSVTRTTSGATSPSSPLAAAASSSSSFPSSSPMSSSTSPPPTPALTSVIDDATSPGTAAVHSSTTSTSKSLASSSPSVTNTTTTALTQSTATTTNSPTTTTPTSNNTPTRSTSRNGMTSLTSPSSPKSHAGVTSTATPASPHPSPSDKPDASFASAARPRESQPTSPAGGASIDHPHPPPPTTTSSADNSSSNSSSVQGNTKSSTDAAARQKTPRAESTSSEDGAKSTQTSSTTSTTTAASVMWRSTESSEDSSSSRKFPAEEEGGWTSGENSVSPTDASGRRTARSTDYAQTSGTPTLQPGVEEARAATSTTTTTTTTTTSSSSSSTTTGAGGATPGAAGSAKPAVEVVVASPTTTLSTSSGERDDLSHGAGQTDSAMETPPQTAVTNTSIASPSQQTMANSSDPEANSSSTDAVTPEVNSSGTNAVTPEANSTTGGGVGSGEFFGSAWTAEPDPYPETGPYPEPGDKTPPGVDGEEEEEEEEGGDEEAVAEPGPDWIVAKTLWKEAWEIHIYVFGGLFGGLGVYILVCVIRLWRSHRLLSRRYFVSLNLLMLLLCATRALYLTMDGYNSRGTFHPSLDYFLYSISFPCLTSAFSIQLYALLQATRMQFLPPTIQKMSMLMTIVVVHFAISITTDVVVGLYAGMEVMLFVCQLFFVFWGLFLFFGYAYIFRRLYVHAVKRQKNASASVYNNVTAAGTGGGAGVSLVKTKRKFTLSVAVTVTMLTAVLGLVTVGLELYGLVGVYKTFSTDRPAPWPWYIYHTSLRLVEFLMCATMGYVASQPFRYRRDHQRCCCPVLCAPCAEICYCGNDVTRSEPQAGWSEIDQHQLRASFDRGGPHPPPQGLHGGNNGHVALSVGDGPKGVRGGGGGDDGRGGQLTTKTRICFSDRDDVIKPAVTSQPGTMRLGFEDEEEEAEREVEGEDESNTLSTRGSLSGGSGSYQGSGGLNSPVPGGGRKQQQQQQHQQNPTAISNHNHNNNNNSISKATTPPPIPARAPAVGSTPSQHQTKSSSSSCRRYAPIITAACNGVVNTAYVPTSSDAGDGRPAAGEESAAAATTTTTLPHSLWAAAVTEEEEKKKEEEEGEANVKSRKASSASSEFFLGPSVSLADSMASELDKAFRSMHEDDVVDDQQQDDGDAGDVFLLLLQQQDPPTSGASTSLRLEHRRHREAAAQEEQQQHQPEDDGAEKTFRPSSGLHGGGLRRSNSATGRCGENADDLRQTGGQRKAERIADREEEEEEGVVPRIGEKGGDGREKEKGGAGRSDPTTTTTTQSGIAASRAARQRPNPAEARTGPRGASIGAPATTTTSSHNNDDNNITTSCTPATTTTSTPTPTPTASSSTNPSVRKTEPDAAAPGNTRPDPPQAETARGGSPVGVSRGVGRGTSPRLPRDGDDVNVRAGHDDRRSSASRERAGTGENGGEGNFFPPSSSARGGDEDDDTVTTDSAVANSVTNIPASNAAPSTTTTNNNNCSPPRAFCDVNAANGDVTSSSSSSGNRPRAVTSPARASTAPYCTVMPVTAKRSEEEEGGEEVDVVVATSAPGPRSRGQRQTASSRSRPNPGPRGSPALTAGPSVNNNNDKDKDVAASPSLQPQGDRSRQRWALPSPAADPSQAPGSSPDPSSRPPSSHGGQRRGGRTSTSSISSNSSSFQSSLSSSLASSGPVGPRAPRGGAAGAGSAVTRPLCKGLLGYGLLDDGDDIEV